MAEDNSCVANKIKILVEENKKRSKKRPHDQIVAIALSHCRAQHREKMVKGEK